MRLIAAAILPLMILTSLAHGAGPIATKVLYAGNPGSDREADFVGFLEKNFSNVGKASLATFTPEQAADYDVVIFDWTAVLKHKPDGTLDEKLPIIEMPPLPKIDDKYDRPTILVSAVAGHFGNTHKLKINWLCLCLNEGAHGMKEEHEIFHRPLEVKMDLVDHPTPPSYGEFPEGKSLGASMKVLLMQSKGYPQTDPGLVSDPYGFEPAPDAEVMSSGLCMKGPKSVAIGRQGNYLQWGFSAAPKEMTDPARACFINCVCYIKKFDHQPVIVHTQTSGRDGVLVLVDYMKEHRGSIDPKLYFDAKLARELGTDGERYVEYFTENLEYVGWGYPKYKIDDDVRELRISNRKIEFLEKLVTMLESNDREEIAKRLLSQYTDKSFDTPALWRAWLNNAKPRLFFTDVGGYRWMETPVK